MIEDVLCAVGHTGHDVGVFTVQGQHESAAEYQAKGLCPGLLEM